MDWYYFRLWEVLQYINIFCSDTCTWNPIQNYVPKILYQNNIPTKLKFYDIFDARQWYAKQETAPRCKLSLYLNPSPTDTSTSFINKSSWEFVSVIIDGCYCDDINLCVLI